MRPTLLIATATAAVVATLLPTTATAADLPVQTWVSGVGDDVNPCSRTAPCKTFAGAISKTGPGGSIHALDPGGYGSVTITKSITIDGAGALASIAPGATNGIIINAGADDDVVLRNLSLDGASCNGITGIRILGGRSLTLDHVRVGGFKTAISYVGPTPSTATPFRLAATHVDLTSDCTSGLDLSPASGNSVRAVLTDSSITGSGTAVKTVAGADLWMSRSRITGNQVAVDHSTGGAVHVGCGTTITANLSNGQGTDSFCTTGGSASGTTAEPTAPSTTTPTGGASRTWISGVGDDANPCSRTAPCQTLSGAVPKTSAGGYVDALDPVWSTGLTLTKALTVDGSSGFLGIQTTSGSGLVINAGPHDDVVLHDLELDGAGCTATTGIRILGGRSLTLDHVRINGFQTAISYEGTADAPFTLTGSSVDISGICGTALGLTAGAGHPVQVTLDDTLIATSGTAIDAGPGAEVWTTGTTIALNDRGLAMNGGTAHAGCASEVVANTTDGAFTDNLCPAPVIQGTIANTARPTIDGEAVVDSTLTASTGSWDNTGMTFSYRWYVNGAATSVTTPTYRVVAGDVDKVITVQVTASMPGYDDASAMSDPMPSVAAAAVTHTGTLTVAGASATVGTILTAGAVTWTPGDVARSYQWSADGTPISGATGSIYTPTAADTGRRLTVTVTGAKPGYTADVVVSTATAPVVAAPPTTITNYITGGTSPTDYCVVPSLRNRAAATATRALRAAGCAVRTKKVHAARKRHGKVVTQSIPAGVSVKRGTVVLLRVGR